MNAEVKLSQSAGAKDGATKKGHTIVFGNEKGGTGKTTTAMHILIALTSLGKTVAAIDLDARQKSFARYIENRADFVRRSGHKLIVPPVQVIERSDASLPETEDAARLEG